MTTTLLCGDCLELMPQIPDKSVDLILCDPPFGTTRNRWDVIIPFEPLWREYWRICKGAVVLFAAQPFTSVLVVSEIAHFKYDWTWRKPKGTGHLNAKKQPMRDKEDILVFYREQPTYNPQFTAGTPYNGSARVGKGPRTSNYGAQRSVGEDSDGRRYPKQVIEFGVVERGTIHPTQKPVALMEYLIRTYSNEGDTILDNCMGSATTGIACQNTNRNFIGIEKDAEMFEKAKSRMEANRPAPEKEWQRELFAV